MRRAAALAVVALVACGSDGPSQSDLMCEQLRAGVPPGDLVGTHSAVSFGLLVYGFVSTSCPEMLGDPVVAAFLSAAGIAPPAPTPSS